MGRILDRGVLVGLGLVVAVLTVNAGLTYHNTQQLHDDAGWVAHSHEVIDLTHGVLLALVDAETGERGFLLTRQSVFLKPYEAALPRLQDQMARLKEKVEDNPGQEARVRELEKLTTARLTALRQRVDLRRKRERDTGALDAALQGRTQMDAIRSLVGDIEQEERTLLAVRERRSRRGYQVAMTTGLLADFLGLALVGVFAWVLVRSLAARQAATRLRDEALARHRQIEEQLTTLVEASGTLTSTLEAPAVLAAILELARRLLPADAYAVWRFHAASGQWRIEAASGLSEAYQQASINVMAQTPQMTEAPVIAEDVAELPLLAERRKAYQAEAIRSLLAVPLRIQGRVCGTLTVYHRRPHAIGEVEVRVGTALANLAAAALGSADLYEAQALLRREAQRQREWLGVTLASIGDAVIATDIKGRVVLLNAVAQGLTGWTQEQAERQPLEAVFRIVHEQTRAAAESPIVRVFREGTVVGLANHTILLARDGAERPIEDSAAPIQDERGDIAGVVLIFRDVTERRRAEAARERAEAALKEADRRKDEFLAMLAHELRNPLAPLRNALHILQLAGDDPGLTAQAREVMERQIEHLVRLVDDLLDVSRIMRGRIELRKEPVELATVVNRAVETSQPGIEAEGHELTVSLPPEPLWLDGDLVRLAQVVSNLLNNAVKYTERGGKICLTGGREGDGAVLRVRDTGIGIAPEVLPQIFDMFVQADRRTKNAQGGMGIGLTLVRRLVEMHGGRVEAHSAGPGRGSEFVVWLPLRGGSDGEPARGKQPERSPAAGLESRRVLVVDDSPDAADTLAMLLRLEGQEVRVAYDGPSALAAAEAAPPDIAFLDLGMPTMDGYELARRMRARQELRTVRLVAVTGWGQDEDRRRTREAGFDEHLVKPVERESLHQLLAGRHPLP
jgi:PAS domain S-box-containing protein